MTIYNVVVRKGGTTVYEACGEILQQPYNVQAGKWICITVSFRADKAGEYRIFLKNAVTGELIDKEPDLFWKDLAIGGSFEETMWGYVPSSGVFKLKIEVRRCTAGTFGCSQDELSDSRELTFNSTGEAPIIPGIPVPTKTEITNFVNTLPSLPQIMNPPPSTGALPKPGCPEGTTRQVKCPKNNKMITQRCVNGAWVTAKDEEKKCDDTQELLVIAVVLLVILFWLFGRKQ